MQVSIPRSIVYYMTKLDSAAAENVEANRQEVFRAFFLVLMSLPKSVPKKKSRVTIL